MENVKYRNGFRQGAHEAHRMTDVGPESTRGYSEAMRISPEDMPPLDQLPMNRKDRIEWLRGFAAGIQSAISELEV